MKRLYYNIELDKRDSKAMASWLREKGIEFETSACYNLIHFEALMSLEESADMVLQLAELPSEKMMRLAEELINKYSLPACEAYSVRECSKEAEAEALTEYAEALAKGIETDWRYQ